MTRTTPYQLLGSEQRVRALCEAFYRRMDTLPEAAHIRAMHSDDLGPVTEKLTRYLTTWMGGPARQTENGGTMCLTKPHEPYHIGEAERDQWLLCFDHALTDIDASDELRSMLTGPIAQVADMVRTDR